MELSSEQVIHIEKGMPPLTSKESEQLAQGVPEWHLEDRAIKRRFTFENFLHAIDFVNQVAELADDADHHPDICISYNIVELTLSTHKIGGLSKNDFIVAARIDQLDTLQVKE